MKSDQLELNAKQVKSVTYVGIAVNSALAAVKVVVGLRAGSLALVAHGIHSLSDLVTDATVLVGIFVSSKKADVKHPYGHGRAETFAGLFIALVLMFVGGTMIYYATVAIAKDEMTQPHFVVLIVALASIFSKEWVYRITQKVARESHSTSLYANAWHHRSDALSSVAVVVGFIALEVGFGHGDQVAAIAVGLMVIYVGVHIIGDVFRELVEGAADSETIKQIEQIIDANADVRHWHKLRSRTVGREVFLDVHILVDPELNVAGAHRISENLEKSLEEQVSRPVNITVHIEPDTPDMRK
ncbi:MAG: cation diffusion facilitator family transporter [Sedimentisphaerales bacterium]